MGQGSKPAIWSTREGLRWSKKWKYKEENPYYKGGSRNQKEGKKKKIVHSRTVIVLKFKRNIQELPSSDIAKEDFPCIKLFILIHLYHLTYCDCYSTHRSPISSTISTNSLFWTL